MKRCPDCEFIYEDEQILCDMDGQTLVPGQALPDLQPRLSATPFIARTSSLKDIGLPVCAGLLLAALLSIGYLSSANSIHKDGEKFTSPSMIQDTSSVRRPNTPAIQSTGSVSALNSTPPTPSQSPAIPRAPQAARNAISDKSGHAPLETRENRLSIARSVPPLPHLRALPQLPEARPLDEKAAPRAPGARRSNLVDKKAKPETVKTKDLKVRS